VPTTPSEPRQPRSDGSAGDADYGTIGTGYARYRQPDPEIAALIGAALGEARSVLNVGAGSGSYEPADRAVTAVEPSAAMRAQRPDGGATAIDATAETYRSTTAPSMGRWQRSPCTSGRTWLPDSVNCAGSRADQW